MKFIATPEGARYHSTAHCEGLNSWFTLHGLGAQPPRVTRREALVRDLKPCLICNPPPLLTAVGLLFDDDAEDER